MREDVNRLAVRAASDMSAREALIRGHQDFIRACAAKAARRRVTREDDEWSVALFAFSAAVDSYDASKGGFLSYADLLIRRRVIDGLRASGARAAELSVDASAFDGYAQEEAPLEVEVTRVLSRAPDTALAEEIETANDVLLGYGFSFFDLAACSPREKRSRADCARVTDTLAEEPPLMRWMRQKRMLPILPLHQKTRVARRTMEKFRRFIIAAAEILDRRLPGLTRYFRRMRREADE